MNELLRFALQNPQRVLASIARRLLGIHHRVVIESVKDSDAVYTYTNIEPPATIFVDKPVIFGKTLAPHLEDVHCTLPELYVAKMHNVTAIARSTMLKTSKNNALYDELAFLSNKKYYGLRFSGMSINSTNTKALFTTWYRKHNIDRAIHLMHEASYNYFHWLVECLPRLSLIDQFPEFDTWPILIDKKLPSQFIDALHIFDHNKKRQLIQISPHEMANVRELAFSSCHSIIRDNYKQIIDPARDVVPAPSAIQILRSRICSQISPDLSAPEKIYISRHGSTRRSILNEDEVENFMRQQGFAILHPALLTFTQQVAYFSRAKVIVSPSGAGLTNMIFAPPGCKVFCLISSNPRSNLYFFKIIAEAINLQFAHVVGQETINTQQHVHNDYLVDIKVLECALNT